MGEEKSQCKCGEPAGSNNVVCQVKDSDPGAWEQLLMEVESKCRDWLLQTFGTEFDEDTPLMVMPIYISIDKKVTEFQFLCTYEIFSPQQKIAEFYFLEIGVRF